MYEIKIVKLLFKYCDFTEGFYEGVSYMSLKEVKKEEYRVDY